MIKGERLGLQKIGPQDKEPLGAKRVIVSGLENGRPRRVVFLAKLGKEKAILVIPEGVEVVRNLTREELKKIDEFGKEVVERESKIGGAIWTIKPGKYTAKDLETGEIAPIKFNPNSHDCLKRAA